MLLIHGVHDHCHTWDWFAARFADHYHIVALDLRGHGDSEWVLGSSYHNVDYVYDIAQLVTQAELTPAVVVGHSMGGTLAALYAGLYPDQVEALVLLEGVGLYPGMLDDATPAERIRSWVDGTRSLAGRIPKRYASLEEAFSRMRSANAHLDEEQARHLTVHGSNQNEDGTYSWKYDNYTHAYHAFRIPADETRAIWEDISSPTLILNATEGFAHRIGQNDTLRHFTRGSMLDIENAGHWVHHDQLDNVVVATEKFLAQT
jgi:pimeloyl-ACP methyl ester carboxylesterase